MRFTQKNVVSAFGWFPSLRLTSSIHIWVLNTVSLIFSVSSIFFSLIISCFLSELFVAPSDLCVFCFSLPHLVLSVLSSWCYNVSPLQYSSLNSLSSSLDHIQFSLFLFTSLICPYHLHMTCCFVSTSHNTNGSSLLMISNVSFHSYPQKLIKSYPHIWINYINYTKFSVNIDSLVSAYTKILISSTKICM